MTTSQNVTENDISKISYSKQKPNPYIPKSGRIYRGPTVNAYAKNSISTIPSSIETVLFKKPNFIDNNPNNNLFTSQGETLKVSISQNSISNRNNLSQSSSASSIHKKKTKKEIPLRFDYSNIEYGKYYPGPADYSPPVVNNINERNNFRYNSLFEFGRENVAALYYTDNNKLIGPGSYDVKLSQGANVYLSPYERFKKKKISETDRKIGPGSYNANFDIGKKDINKTSFFFKKENSFPSTNPESMFINTEQSQGMNNNIGPGTYDIESYFNRRKQKENSIVEVNKVKNFNDIKKEIKRSLEKQKKPLSISTEPTKEKNDDKQYKNFMNMYNDGMTDNDPRSVNKFNHVMNSKVPRFGFNPIGKKNHLPGPCYYQPSLLKKNRNFNANINHKWI